MILEDTKIGDIVRTPRGHIVHVVNRITNAKGKVRVYIRSKVLNKWQVLDCPAYMECTKVGFKQVRKPDKYIPQAVTVQLPRVKKKKRMQKVKKDFSFHF